MISNIKIIARCIHFFCIPKPFLACTYTCRFVYWKMIHYFIYFYSGFFLKYFGIVRIEWGICRVCPKTKCRYLRQVQSGLHQHLHHRCIYINQTFVFTMVVKIQTFGWCRLLPWSNSVWRKLIFLSTSHLTGVQSCNRISCIEQENYNYFNITSFLQHWDTIYILINVSFRREW